MSSGHIPKFHAVYTIAVIGFIYTLHLVIPMYSNSSFLALFADERTIGFIYMAGSAVSIFGFLIVPSFIRKAGNYTAALWLICIQIVLCYGLISASNPTTLAVLFILQTACVSLIGLCLDIFLEGYTSSLDIGRVRGLYGATLNASWVIAPLIGSMLIDGTNNYRNTYVAALAMLFPLLYLIYRNLPRFKDPNYIHLSPWQLIKHISRNKNWTKLFLINIILQTFYSWMIIYTPIYLHNTVGFSWETIGIILVIMLLPFALITYPLGRLADEKYGEKEIMAIGFVIMGIATMLLAYTTSQNFFLWAFILFMTRIGAAAAEIMIETYFFKKVSVKDTPVLGAFRITRPLAYFIAPLITTVGLIFTTHQNLFIIIGLISLVAVLPALLIEDTK